MADAHEAAMQLPGWYPLAAAVLTALIQAIRKNPATKAWWDKVPNGWRFLPVVLLGALVGGAEQILRSPSLGQALEQALGGALGIGALAMGLAAALKESKLPWDGGAGGSPRPPDVTPKPPPVTVITALSLVVLTSSACFHEAYPCDEGTALALAAECTAKYETCKDAGHPDDCPEASACEQKGIERDRYCTARIHSESK